MIIQPKIRGFICTTAHPAGCAENVRRQAAYARARGPVAGAPRRVLVVGCSAGYGLAARVAAAFAHGATTVGVCLERPGGDSRTATAGWYNDTALRALATEAGLAAHTIMGDAFSNEIKALAVDAVKERLPGGKVDLVVYSVAAPRRTHPVTGETFSSVIKPVGEPFVGQTVNVQTGELSQVTVQPATEDEIRGTVAVMGGEDWLLWIRALLGAGVLAPGARTTAFSYLGPPQTHAIYRDGTIGRAKEDLDATAAAISGLLRPLGGRAFVSVNKALVTQASSAIPVVPLYMALLFRVMKKKGTHEGCIEQMARFYERVYGPEQPFAADGEGRLRLDDLEMDDGVQREVARLWNSVTQENLSSVADLAGYREDFLRLFGFGFENVNYGADVQP